MRVLPSDRGGPKLFGANLKSKSGRGEKSYADLASYFDSRRAYFGEDYVSFSSAQKGSRNKLRLLGTIGIRRGSAYLKLPLKFLYPMCFFFSRKSVWNWEQASWALDTRNLTSWGKRFIWDRGKDPGTRFGVFQSSMGPPGRRPRKKMNWNPPS